MAERKAKRVRAELALATEPAAPKEDAPSVSSFLQSWAWKREHRPDRDRFQRPYVHSLTLPATAQSGNGGVVKLTLEQARFRGAQGFASTVWDSSIVVSKFLERNPNLVAGKAVLDLSAGCGLVAVVAARLGACRTVATDLGPNLPLLRRNCERNGTGVEVWEHWWGNDVTPLLLPSGRGAGGRPNGAGQRAGAAAAAAAAAAGPAPQACKAEAAEAAAEATTTAATDGAAAGGNCGGAGRGGDGRTREATGGGKAGRLDLVVACDVMYTEEAVGPLVTTLAGLCGGRYDPDDAAGDAASMAPPPGSSAAALASGAGAGTGAAPAAAAAAADFSPTVVLLAHGRNRFAEASFWRHAARAGFISEAVPWDELDPVYRCTDVDVYRLQLRLRRLVAVGGSEAEQA